MTHVAQDYIAARISVFPLDLDGTKAPQRTGGFHADGEPRRMSWNPYRERFATEHELQRLFAQPAGIGVVCGLQSGGLEVIDFDHDADEVFPAWHAMLPAEIRARLCVVETGGLGYHVIYRCEVISGNHKIAMTSDGKTTVIETRGEGGYVVGAGSPLEVHDSGNPYVQVAGEPLPVLPTFTPDERRIMWQQAESFDQRDAGEVFDAYVDRRAKELAPVTSDSIDTSKPRDDFDVNESWSNVLTPHGWTSRDGVHWTRPGKSFGTSAKVVQAKNGCHVLTVFSGNAGTLAPSVSAHKTFGKFGAFTALNHCGDPRGAAKAVCAMGYGRSQA